jgi:hypothetical protein
MPAWTVVAATSDDVLSGALKDPRVVKFDQAVSLSAEARSVRLIEKAEFKVDRGEIPLPEASFGLRFYPSGISVAKAGSRFQKAFEENEKAARDEGISLLLVSRYQLLARIANLKEKKGIADELSKLTQKASRALSFAANKDRAELKSYLKAKSDLDRLQIKVADIERDFVNLQIEMQSLGFGTLENFELLDWADMNDLRARLKVIKQAKPETLTAKVATLEAASARTDVEFARAVDDRWLEHVEISMKENTREKIYGVQVAFNLPFLTAPDLSRIEKTARVLRAEAKALDAAEISSREFENGLVELRTLLDLHRSLVESQSKLNPEQMRKASERIASQDPLLAVEMQRSWYESRDQILELELRIRTLFISYLHESSELAKAPEVNQFSKSLKRVL